MAAAARGMSMLKRKQMMHDRPIEIQPKFSHPKNQLMLKLIRRPDFLSATTLGFFILANGYYWLILRTSTLQMLTESMSREPLYFVLFSILVPATLLLFGLNFGLAVILYRASVGRPGLGGSFFAALVGAFGVGCPACGAFLLSLVGVGAGLAVLPFGGLELWAVASTVMAATVWSSLARLDQQTCNPNLGVLDCWQLPASNPRLSFIIGVISFILAFTLVWTLVANEPFI